MMNQLATSTQIIGIKDGQELDKLWRADSMPVLRVRIRKKVSLRE